MVAALLSLAAPQGASAAVTPRVPGKACERTLVRPVTLSDPARPDILTVRAAGPSCAAARIVVSLRNAAGRTLWTEAAFLGAVQEGRLPGEPGPEVTLEAVIAAVEHWVSVETSSDAPAWPRGVATLGAATLAAAPGATLYETRLDRAAYARVRAAREPMLCIPVGPESAHCIARDPSSGRVVELLGRGL